MGEVSETLTVQQIHARDLISCLADYALQRAYINRIDVHYPPSSVNTKVAVVDSVRLLRMQGSELEFGLVDSQHPLVTSGYRDAWESTQHGVLKYGQLIYLIGMRSLGGFDGRAATPPSRWDVYCVRDPAAIAPEIKKFNDYFSR